MKEKYSSIFNLLQAIPAMEVDLVRLNLKLKLKVKV